MHRLRARMARALARRLPAAAFLGLLGCAKAVDDAQASGAARRAGGEATPPAETLESPVLAPPSTAAEPEAIADGAETPASRGSTQKRRPSARGERHEVVRVIDGDTIQVDVDGSLERVRYIGIDTPETVHPRKGVECFGKEASAKNAALVGGKTVRLVRDVSDRDRYGRLLRYVWVDDVFVNLELVREGYAQVSTYPPDVEHTDAFIAAQREAREANRGLWAACPAPPEPEPKPRQAAPTATAGPKGCTIKGNINSKGDKIYHRPDCPSYAQTKIDESAGQRWFCSPAEAEAAGWRVAKNCP
jgi:micrococcal nuclease